MFTTTAVAHPHKKRVLQGRRLVVVDIENVAGGAVLSLDLARWTRKVLESSLGVTAEDQVVMAVSHVGFIATATAWPQARVRLRSGKDGADIELLEILETERLEDRFDEVVLVSGTVSSPRQPLISEDVVSL